MDTRFVARDTHDSDVNEAKDAPCAHDNFAEAFIFPYRPMLCE